jgi:APA family basic amino acid/polyamine antiporter
MSKQKIGLFSATAIVVANMIGTGVFVSLGYQVMGIHSGFSLLLLWILGGITALLGALCYGEIGSAFTRSGGEYNYLSELYHPAVGFLSGFVSSTVAFAAPVAAAALVLGVYAGNVIPGIDPKMLGAGVVIAFSILHGIQLKAGSRVQNFFTAGKILLIIFIIIAGFASGRTGNTGFMPHQNTWAEILSAVFASNLYFVSYAYSGWNAAAYISAEIENPRKNLPKALLLGTLLVTILYVLLNFVFLYTAPQEKLSTFQHLSPLLEPRPDVGFISAGYIFGATGAKIISMIIAVLLMSTVSAMIIAGPRVSMVLGEDVRMFRFLAKKNKNGVPTTAVIFQAAISFIFIFTSSFADVVKYIGFTLALFTTFTVIGVFILRIRQKGVIPEGAYRTWGYPVTPILFLILNLWIVIYGFTIEIKASLEGLGTILCGLIIYFINKKITPKPTHESLQK